MKFLKNLCFLTLMILASGASAAESQSCSNVLLVTPGMDKYQVSESDYKLGMMREIKSHFANIKDVMTAKGFTVMNDFSVSKIDRSKFNFDCVVEVNYGHKSRVECPDFFDCKDEDSVGNMMFPSYFYSAYLKNKNGEIIDASSEIAKEYSYFPRSGKWLKQVAEELKAVKTTL